ncbi:MAG: hypothetical protein ACREJC_10155 [Tepidisphaeraceae bacterium]
MTTEQPATTEIESGDIVATAGRYYRNTRYIMAALLVAFGAWFAYDGWVRWPEENRKVAALEAEEQRARSRGDQVEQGRIAAEKKQYTHHSDTDLMFQKVLALTLPPIGLTLLVRALYNSRGQYRMSGTTISVPGHPPVDLNDIRELDHRLWERKGIAYVTYDQAGQEGTFKLDDFVYDRPPTDKIFDRIKAHVLPESAGAEPPAAQPVEDAEPR